MSESRRVPLLIVGGGPAGLTSAIYSLRSGIECEVIERAVPGGQVFIADRIENYPGFIDPIAGSELSDRMKAQAERFGARIIQDEVVKVEVEGDLKKVTLQRGGQVACDALVVATGSRPRQLGIPGEMELWGRGVSYCATCDGNFFRGQKLAVIGGGDSACQEASMLSHLASEVYIIHRRDQFRAQEYIVQCAMSEPNVKVLWDTVAERVEGKDEVKGVSIRNVKTGEESLIEVQGVFIYVGLIPLTDFLQGVVELSGEGYVAAGEDTITSVPGIFAAGDCRVKPLRQVATAVADGANAIRSMEMYFIERGISSRYV